MKQYFLTKIKHQKEDENGKLRNVTEPYLFDAVSHTEAEARAYQELSGLIRGDFEVSAIAKPKISDVFHYEDAETWYQAKVQYIAADDNGGKEKKVTNLMLVTANDIEQATSRVIESMHVLIVFEVVEVKKTAIVEVFPYVEDSLHNYAKGAFAEVKDPVAYQRELRDGSDVSALS